MRLSDAYREYGLCAQQALDARFDYLYRVTEKCAYAPQNNEHDYDYIAGRKKAVAVEAVQPIQQLPHKAVGEERGKQYGTKELDANVKRPGPFLEPESPRRTLRKGYDNHS